MMGRPENRPGSKVQWNTRSGQAEPPRCGQMETRLGAIPKAEKVREHLRKWWARVLKVPPGLSFLGGAVIGGLLVAVVAWREMPPIIGVLVGAVISGAFASIIALEARRIQLAATTWSRRLEVHQEAFFLWHQCWSVVHENDQKKRDDTVNKAREWWLNNCLYLSEEARDRFVLMMSSVQMYNIRFKTRIGSEEGKKEIMEDWDLIRKTGQIIIKGSYSHISDAVIQGLSPADPYGSEIQKKLGN